MYICIASSKSGSQSLTPSATTLPLIAGSPLPLWSTPWPGTDQSTASPLPLRSIQLAGQSLSMYLMYKQKDSDLTCIMLYTNVEKQTTPTLKKSVTVSKYGI